ncbi:MAG: peptidylprolyl isomerase, partial [Acetobacteraceae bacterium]|nr:peptidylprolyl isomerase [Acetobacteraceae bacterium]
MTRSIRLAVSALALLAAAPALAAAAPTARLGPAAARPVRILAVVNGTVITSEDVDNRARLFAVSSSLPQHPEVLERLRPQ